MAFDSLSEKLQNVFKNLRSKGKLTEDDVKAALKEVKMALLEADVNFKVVKQFTKSVQERAIGQDVMNGLNPGQMVIKIVNEEMIKLMGSETTEIAFRPGKELTVIIHCLNVGLITRMIGRWLHMEKTDVNTLTIAGVLHDIGKCKIPDDVLNKPDKLTDEEFALIKKHPQFGFDLIRDLQIDSRIKRTALMHHERCDGSGYPSQLDSSLIDDFAMITAIADVYDAMTAARRYRAPLCPFAVISSFESEGFTKYNTKFLLLFLKKLATTYQSNRVMLNDSRFCNIVMLNPHELSRPIVRFDDGSILDLSTNREFFIKSVM